MNIPDTLQLLVDMQNQNEKRFELIAKTFEDALDSIKRLERIAMAHEQRLDDIEGQ